MNPKLYVTLYKVIEKWVEDADVDESPALVSKSVTDNMAKAAAAVWDMMIESSEYTIKENVS